MAVIAVSAPVDRKLRSLDEACQDAVEKLHRTARTDPLRRERETRVDRLQREIRYRADRAARRERP